MPLKDLTTIYHKLVFLLGFFCMFTQEELLVLVGAFFVVRYNVVVYCSVCLLYHTLSRLTVRKCVPEFFAGL